MPAKQLSDGDLDGTVLGQSVTDKIAFYGKTTIVQPAATAQSAIATTTITALVTTPTATDIATAVNALITRVTALTTWANQARTDLVNLGLQKGSN